MMTEDELRLVDLLLKGKQAFWETPRNLAVVVIAGVIGFKLAGQPQRIVVQIEQPLAVKLMPEPLR